MSGDDNKMVRLDFAAILEECELDSALSKETKEEARLQKNARMFINKQHSNKMRDKPLFPIIRMRLPIRK